MNLDTAIAEHLLWKHKFCVAIARHEELDVAIISQDDCCELGKFLHGEAKARYGHLGSYMNCVSKHQIFHVEAGRIAAAINSKDYASAAVMMNATASFGLASSRVVTAITRLKEETVGIS